MPSYNAEYTICEFAGFLLGHSPVYVIDRTEQTIAYLFTVAPPWVTVVKLSVKYTCVQKLPSQGLQ